MRNSNGKIRLAFDVHHLLLENAGTKRVTDNLLHEFYKNSGMEVLACKPSYRLFFGRTLGGKLLGHLCRFFWVHIHLPIVCYRKNIDVLLSPEFHNPLFTTCKRMVIVHDVHMRAQREFNSSLWFYLYYVPFIEKAIKRADRIITISDFAKQQIEQYMKVDEKKMAVVYWGVDPLFLSVTSKETFEALSLQYHISKNRYFLFVGTFEARKNVERIVEAFALLQKRTDCEHANLKLLIVGKHSDSKFSDKSAEIEALVKLNELTEKVVFCGFVPDDCLAELYSNALCLLFPSLYEGFGFPIIEGFASGTPVITSNICSMPEVAGGAALLVDPYNMNDIEQKMYNIFSSPDTRMELILKGKKRVEIFKWENSSHQIAEYLFLLAR